MIRTPDQRLRVFVSSTLQELAAERVAAHEAILQLRLVPVMFELGARPHPPSELYRAYLEQSQIFVGLYWERYGWVAPDMTISGLEDEWVLAANHPKLVYLKESSSREPRLVQLIDRIRADNSTSYRAFSSPEELRELLQNDLAVMLSERFDDPAPAPVKASAPTVTPSCPIPNPPSAIIGRDLELRSLEGLITHGDTRLVTISGSGGSGKTRLAVELAALLRDERGLEGVVFVDLSGLRSSSLVLPTIAAALGVKDAGERTMIEAIASVVEGNALLLVIDNFEHVIDAATDLAEILAVTSELKMVVTSRQPLRLRWEQDFPLRPLTVPDPVEQTSVEAVGASPAVELLVERIKRVRPNFALADDNVAAVAEIARRLDGLPLALELAAARMHVLEPSDLLARLEHRLDALAVTARDVPLRHRTLRATIAWSHEHLSDQEQKVFRRMGVFAGGAGIEALEAVCSGDGVDRLEVLDLVESLVDKSLVVRHADLQVDVGPVGTRLTMLETLREFAVEELVAAGEAESTWDRHLEWHVTLAEAAWTGFWTSEMPAWLSRIEPENDNLRSALDHAAGVGDPVLGLRIGAALWPYWDVRGQYREGARRLEDLLDHAPGTPSIERGRALSARGWLLALLGEFEAAMALMDEGLPLVRAHGTDRQLAWSLAEQGNVAFTLGRAEQTEQLFTEALGLAGGLEDPFLTGLCLFGLAYAAFLEGDLEGMKTKLNESLDNIRFMFQPWGIAWTQFSLGVVSIVEGDTRAAVPPITESLQLRWSIRDARGLAESIQLLATLASAHGEWEWSALLHGAAELQREANGLTILPFLRPLHDESVDRLVEALGREQLDEVWRLGRSMLLEKLVAEAFARSPSLTT